MPGKSLEYYMKLPYTIEVTQDAGEEYSGWFARIVELPGCMTQADTFEELGEMIKDAMRGWIEVALEDGIAIPEPRPVESYSGKFVVRVPRSLHRQLVEVAEREGVSLNQYISTTLGKAVGQAKSSILVGDEIIADEQLSQVIEWKRLSKSARRILEAHGFSQEAQDVDERLFSYWIDDHLNQTRTAIEMANYKDAVEYIRDLSQSLELMCDQSPLVRTYCRAIKLLEDQVVSGYRMYAGIMEQARIQQRVLAQARSSTFIFQHEIQEIPSNRDLFSIKDVDNPWSSISSELDFMDRDRK